MFRYISIFIFLLIFGSGSFAQTINNSAPINWERYAVSAGEVSLLLPKMPVMLYSSEICYEVETRSYYVYADEVVYSLIITGKHKEKIPANCTEKKKFGKGNFNARVQEIKNASEKIREENLIFAEKKVNKILFKHSTVWLYDDLINDRWYELRVNHRENAEVDLKAFVESIKFAKNPEGIEIGVGSERTLGDEKAVEENSSGDNVSKKLSATNQNQSLTIIAKPKPRYTDGARQANIQGTINLRVTFLANGGIGTVTPVSALSHGLTEQAIAASKKLVFLPQKVDGKLYTVVKTVQYNFSIY